MPKVLYQADGGVGRVTLNRPEKRNALDAEVIGGVAQALDRAATDQNVKIILLSGAGKDFCSGADLEALREAATKSILDNVADARHLADLFLRMRRHPRLIVAAVRGRALAGGCGLATACDLIVASDTAQFGYPEVNIGFVPAMVMAFLRRSVSEKRALELIVTGEPIGAPTALEIGLINQVFPDDEFDRKLEAHVAKLASRSSSAITLAKNLLYQIDAMSFEAALEAGVQTNAIARMTDDCRRGLERFLKRS